MKKTVMVLILVMALLCALFCAGAVAESEAAYSKLGYALDVATVDGDVMSVEAWTADGKVLLTTKPLDEHAIYLRTSDGDEQILKGTFLDITYDAEGNVIEFTKLFNLSEDYNVWFDTIKYGAEFAPVNGEPGKAIAAGWVLGKDDASIVIGSTNHFEETYDLASDVKVYEVNTEAGEITPSTLEAIPVTEKTEGLFSLTPIRQPAIVIFDSNYKNYETAKAVEIYYITPPSEVKGKLLLHQYDTMPLYSGNPDTAETGGVLSNPYSAAWIDYTEPFAMVPNRMYFVGDTDVLMVLFVLDEEGHFACLDAGSALVGYNIFQTVEEAGFDPRMCSILLLSHGHGDHYGCANQWHEMVTNAGNDMIVYESREDSEGLAAWGWPELGPTLHDTAVIDIIDKYYEYGEWVQLGKWTRMQTFLNAGHTKGTVSYFFEVTQEDGNKVTWGYIGGMGTKNNASNGYLRSQFVYFMRYAQQMYSPDFCMPQHTAHFPIVEINKAAKAAGIPLMEAMVGGDDTWCNFIEMRLDCQVYEKYLRAWEKDPHINVTYADGTTETVEVFNDKKRVTNEEVGPWKREAGEYTITLVDADYAVKLIHGFNAVTAVSDKLNGVLDIYGNNLGNGILQKRDAYVHDPDAWYLQIAMHVDDDYAGEFRNLEGATNGPVECLMGEGWFELNRTQAMTRDQAEQLLATLQAGKSYKVNMTRDSDIVLAENLLDTFVPVD